MTTKYRDGTAIADGRTGYGTWDGTDHGYYAYPPAVGNGGEANLNTDIIPNKLGFVYQWGAVNSGKLCPTGWHVPTDTEFKTLVEYLGTAGCEASTGWQCTPAGSKLKSVANWSNTNGTNTSGFSAVGAGYRGTDGSFYYRSAYAYFWSSSVSGASAVDRHLYCTEARVSRAANSAAYGFSVRCLRD
jgi:uncharacterized protein (TIGR02145 family)